MDDLTSMDHIREPFFPVLHIMSERPCMKSNNNRGRIGMKCGTSTMEFSQPSHTTGLLAMSFQFRSYNLAASNFGVSLSA